MLLPLPFSRGVILCGAPIEVGRHDAHVGSRHLAEALAELDRVAATP